MSTRLTLSVEHLQRSQPGGIGTYIRGLLGGLGELVTSGERDADIEILAARGQLDLASSPRVVRTPFGERVTTRWWRFAGLGVATNANVVHATTMAGPFRGGANDAVHSVLIHDVLWRDHPELTTRRGVTFHEQRYRQIRARGDLRVLVTSRDLADRLVGDGFDSARLHVVRLGVKVPAATSTPLEALGSIGLSADVTPGNYSICVGTIQPRKNIERLVTAHSLARQRAPELGPLVLVGARGWGDVDTTGAIVVSDVDDATMNALVHGARVAAYVPIEEGWGLPAVEALAAGRPLVASRAVPSVRGNSWAITVDPTSVDDLAAALVSAVAQDDDESARAARANSVVDLTWANCARDHWAAWS